jgi:eight-cysteine-cluster-containing protein
MKALYDQEVRQKGAPMRYVGILSLTVGLMCASACAEGPVEYGSVSANVTDLRGDCPGYWTDPSVIGLLCAEGYTLDYQTFDGTLCVRCAPNPNATCQGAWVPVAAEIACAPGYEFVYRADGLCKRCAPATTLCHIDADCFRTGCSGQICSDVDVATTCEFLPEYACYADEYCVCLPSGICGWADDPVLNQCLEDAESPPIISL